MRLLDLELGEAPAAVPDRSRDGRPYRLAVVLVRIHGTPIGCVEVPLDGGRLDGEALGWAVATNLRDAIAAHLRDDAVDGGGAHPAALHRTSPALPGALAARHGGRGEP